jgi:hypothetical protein
LNTSTLPSPLKRGPDVETVSPRAEKMGIAHSDLTAVANVNIRFTLFTFIFTMVLCSKSWKSSLLAPLLIVLYHIIVTIGADIQNPLDNYVGQNLFDANRILNIVEICLCVAFSQLAWAWFRILDIQEWFPLRRKLPKLAPDRSHLQVVFDPKNETYTTEEVPEKPSRTHRHWGLAKTSPSWLYLVATFLYIFGFLCGAQIVYDQFIMRTGKDIMAYMVLLFVPLGGGLLYLAFRYFRPDTYVDGPTKAYLVSKASTLQLSDEQIDMLSKATRSRALWSVVPVVAFHFIGALALGAARELSPSADTNWLCAVGLFTGYFILLIIVFIGMKWRASNSGATSGGKGRLDDSGDFYEDVASSYPLTTVKDSSSGGAYTLTGRMKGQ